MHFKFNKNLIIPTVAVTLFSCSVKKESQGAVANVLKTQSIEEMLDSDGDGIPDSYENSRGTNPYIADIPRIKVSSVSTVSMSGTFRSPDEEEYVSKEIVLPQKFAEAGDIDRANKDYLKTLRRKILANQSAQIKNIEADKEDVITNEDLRASILSSWENGAYYDALNESVSINDKYANESGKVNMSFKIKAIDTKGVSEISNIKLKTFFYDFKKMQESEIYTHILPKEDGTKEKIKIYNEAEANPVTLYKIVSTDLSTSTILSSIKNRNEIGLKFTDYDYISSGIELNYSNVLQKVLDRDAKIVISDGKKTEIFFVSPIYSVEDALKMLGKKVTKDAKGGISAIDGIETNANLPIDFDTVSKADQNKGVWSLVGNSDSLSEKLTEKGFYFISYATIKDLIEASRQTYNHPDSSTKFRDSLRLERIIEGDEVKIQITELGLEKTIESLTSIIKNKPIEDHCKFHNETERKTPCTNLADWQCEIISSTPVVSITTEEGERTFLKNNIEIKNELGETVDYDVFTAKNIIHIIFNKQLPYLRNNLFVKLKPKTDYTHVRTGVISDSCPGGRENYTTSKYNQSVLFKTETTLYTQTKY